MVGKGPGWYGDRDDPTLARWFDGDQLTEHTLVIADQPPGRTPPPPGRTPAVPAADPSLDWSPERLPLPSEHSRVRHRTRLAPPPSRLPGWWPRPPSWSGLTWFRIGVPAGAAAVVVLALAAVSLGDAADTGSTVDSDLSVASSASLDDSVDAALTAGDLSWFSDATYRGLIPIACAAAEAGDLSTLTRQIATLRYDRDSLQQLFVGLEAGTDAHCPDAMAGTPRLLDEAHAAVGQPATELAVAPPVTEASTTTTSTTKAPRAASPPASQPPAATTTVPPTSTTSSTTTTVVLEAVTPGAACSAAGTTGVSTDGDPMTCAEPCDGSTSALSWRGQC